MQTIIETKDLCKDYQHVRVTKNLDLSIYDGDFTVIMGASGSGKSTLLYLLSGMEKASSGEVKFLDTIFTSDVSDHTLSHVRKFHMGFVFQAMHLVPTLSVFENVTVPRSLTIKDKPKLKEKATSLLESFDVFTHAHKYPRELSGGEQQRVAVARALINAPKVLFADEPTGALNSSSSEQVLNLLSRLHHEGQSIVMVTHDLKAAARASRIIFLVDGRVDGELRLKPYLEDDLKTRQATIFNFLKAKGW